MKKLEKTVGGRTSALYFPSLVGNLVWETRRKKRMTQKDLASVTSLTQADISNIEKGKVNINLSTLKKLASGLDVNIRITAVSDRRRSNE